MKGMDCFMCYMRSRFLLLVMNVQVELKTETRCEKYKCCSFCNCIAASCNIQLSYNCFLLHVSFPFLYFQPVGIIEGEVCLLSTAYGWVFKISSANLSWLIHSHLILIQLHLCLPFKFLFSVYLLFFVPLYLVFSRECSGNPLQYSFLENPMDGGAWQAAVHGVAKSRT